VATHVPNFSSFLNFRGYDNQSKGRAMTIEIPLLPEEEARLRTRAAAAQKELLTFVREAVLEKLDRPSLDELLAPVQQDVQDSGVTESELDAAIEQARDEVWNERKSPG
jgi:hypothetical protein